MDSTTLIGLGPASSLSPFHKGNSRAFKEIKTPRTRCAKQRSRTKAVVSSSAKCRPGLATPLESHFTQDEVIPLGVEATFAGVFC